MANALKQYINENGWNIVRVNGRKHYNLNMIDEIQPATYEGQTLESEWIVRARDRFFTVYGGRKSGAGRSDWFVVVTRHSGSHPKAIQWTEKCTSLIDCLRFIDCM